QHQFEATLGEFVGEIADQRHEERIGKMLATVMAQRHDHSDRTALASAQIARESARTEIMLLGKLADALGRLGIDDVLASESTRDRRRGNPGELGQIIDGTILPGQPLSPPSGSRGKSAATALQLADGRVAAD